ncbi:MAG: serine/threonine protein kinase [Deltaproteobacteria bacterium]|nr:serine/threonine protein kinase [Deltaproteobacteria bacterium]
MQRCPTCHATYRGQPKTCPLDGATLQTVRDQQLGQRVGEWELCQVLAEGNLATVYRARRGQQFGALKLYQPTAPLQRVRREVDSQLRLDSPHIARQLDHGELVDGAVYLVTEFVDGTTLRAHLQQTQAISSNLPWRTAVHIASQIARGLETIHACGLVHRDLKPENLMLAGDRRDRLVILDLGHALVLDSHRLTQSGLVWGSAPYMSPEQAAGQTVDGRSDLYTLGVIFYELLVGRRPFEATAAVDLMQLHWTQTPISPTLLVEIPRPASDLCMWLLSKHPDRRPDSAHLVAAALDGMLAAAQRSVVPHQAMDMETV